jgi:hypothetical protein
LSRTSIAAILFLTVGLAYVVGRHLQLARAPATPDRPDHRADTVGTAHDCRARCFVTTITMARARLGLDPNPRGGPTTSLDDELRAIQHECHSLGSVLREITVTELRDDPGNASHAVGFLADKNGHLHILLGTVEAADGALYQVAHGNSEIALVRPRTISPVTYPRAWKFEGEIRSVPLRIGSGVLLASELDHNFGGIKPSEQLTTIFTFTNIGSVPLVFGEPESSCSCTVASAIKGTVLKPSDSADLKVSVATSNTASLRQLVNLPVSEFEGNASRTVHLTLVGSQRNFKQISPGAIDFGVVARGQSCGRNVRLTETPHDRFRIRGIDHGSLPITSKRTEGDSPNGLRTYDVALMLCSTEYKPGPHQGFVTLLTDSAHGSEVRLPVRYDLARAISVTPATIAFGEVDLEAPHHAIVRISPVDGGPIRVTLKSAPPEARAQIRHSSDSAEMTITFQFSRAGPWSGTIEADVQYGVHEELITLQCAAIGKAL